VKSTVRESVLTSMYLNFSHLLALGSDRGLVVVIRGLASGQSITTVLETLKERKEFCIEVFTVLQGKCFDI